jgi:membrane protein
LVILLGETARKFQKDRVMQAAASISFFILLTVVPLTLVTLIVGGAILEGENVSATLVEAVEQLAGPQAAEIAQRVIDSLGTADSTTNTTIFSLLVALWAASTAFAHLRQTLNVMWETPQASEGVKGYVLRRMIGIGFLFLLGVMLMLAAVLSRLLINLLEAIAQSEKVEGAISVLFSDFSGFLVLFIVFFIMYRILPHRRLPTADLVVGSVVTTALFLVGEWGLSIYFSRASHVSLYGAAGAAMALLLWMYYSATVVLTSAEFTYVWSERENLWVGTEDLTLKEAVMQQLPGRLGSRSET